MSKEAEKLIKLIQENPDFPIIPMVDSEVVADDYATYWRGEWGGSNICEIYDGREYLHVKENDDPEDVLKDMVGCKYGETKDGRDIYDLSEKEWDTLYNSLPWTKAIIVYITT